MATRQSDFQWLLSARQSSNSTAGFMNPFGGLPRPPAPLRPCLFPEVTVLFRPSVPLLLLSPARLVNTT